MTNVQRIALKKDAQNFIAGKGLKTLCYRAGVGSNIIADIIEERFDDVTIGHLKKVQSIVNTQPMSGLYKTSDCQAFMNAADTAMKHKLMIGITGNTGAGKSYMANALARKDEVLYYNCHLKKSAKTFFENLLINMRQPCNGNVSDLIDRVAREINYMDSPLLIVDEACKMSPEIRSAVHTLRDRTLSKCGILLIGMPALKNDLIAGKEKGKLGFAELYRRVNIWHHLEGLKPEEIKTILKDSGITAPEQQREFRKYNSFGELMNEIQLYKLLNDQL
jgi:hypothetical protein